jgi:hypothetical protein
MKLSFRAVHFAFAPECGLWLALRSFLLPALCDVLLHLDQHTLWSGVRTYIRRWGTAGVRPIEASKTVVCYVRFTSGAGAGGLV